jgi:DNA-binding protein HU-beta
MTKAELVRAIAEKSGTTMTDAIRVLDALGAVAATTLSSGGEVTLPGIGKLASVQKAERQGRNPRTGEMKTIPAKKAVKFKAAAALKAVIQ